MELIRFILSSSRRRFILAILAGAGAGLSMVGLLAFTNQALHAPGETTATTGLLFLALIIAMVVLRVSSTVLLTQLSQHSIAAMRLRLSQAILNAPLVELERYGPHRLLATLSTDIGALANGIMRLPFLCMNTAVLIGALAYMLWLSGWLFAVALCLMAVGVLAYRWPQSRAIYLLKAARTHGDHLYQHFRAVCEGTKELKMNRARRQAFLSGPLQQTAQHYSDKTIAGTRYYSFAGSFGLMMFFLVIACLLFVLPHWSAVEPATLVGYVIVFLFIQGPMEGIMTAIPELAKTAVSLKKIQALGLSLNTDINETIAVSQSTNSDSAKPRPLGLQHSLALVDIRHRYCSQTPCETDDSHFQLGPINLHFTPGEIVFLMGGNGSGKTTLAKILMGLYKPDSGSILVDGQRVSHIDYENYRQLFSVVFVDFFLQEQLLGFSRDSLDQQTQYYLEQLQLSHKVTVENGRLSTIQLSQGQKKRLTLLTAYLEDRPCYIFDEWAADQDPEFKQLFYRKILPDLKSQGKIVIVISHDEQYFDMADRYIKMEAGRVTVME